MMVVMAAVMMIMIMTMLTMMVAASGAGGVFLWLQDEYCTYHDHARHHADDDCGID